MERASIEKYAIFALIVVAGIALDQWTKWYASRRLANAQVPGGHEMTVRVPASADGEALRTFLRDELSANGPKRIDRIAENWVLGPDGMRIGPEETVREGELLTIIHRKVTVLPGFFEFEYAENRGAAFSLLADADSPYRMPFLIGFSALALLVILYLLAGVRRSQLGMIVALSLVATGAVGNLIDRIRLGYVIDFILWKYGDAYRWPNFNLADAFISVGVVMMLIGVFFGEPPEEES